jgi:hypothetical protein
MSKPGKESGEGTALESSSPDSSLAPISPFPLFSLFNNDLHGSTLVTSLSVQRFEAKQTDPVTKIIDYVN